MTSNRPPSPARPVHLQHRTNLLERFLLFAMLVIMPLEDQIPTIGGRSVIWLLFLAMGGYILAFRLPYLLTLLGHRFFLAAYLFLFIGLSVETFHPHPDFRVIARLAQMIFGALLVGTLCRDEAGLKTVVCGYLAAGLWLGGWLFVNDYGALRGTSAANFEAANQIRAVAFEDKSLAGNLNSMAFFCAQGALAGLVLSLAARTTAWRSLFAATGLFCLVAAFLPLSRSGVLCALAASAAVLWLERSWNLRYLLLILALAGGVYLFAPQASLVRATNLSFHTRYESGKLEARARLYEATVRNLPEYFWMGVGAGNFYNQWGLNHGFIHDESVMGTHNAFFEVTTYWGLLGLMSLALLVWLGYRCIPFQLADSPWGSFLFGLFVCLILRMLTSHNLYAKEFSLGFGLLTAADAWLWPRYRRSSEEPAFTFMGHLNKPLEEASGPVNASFGGQP